tara:strand:+ start:14914 stop:15528 length:615 start_codon:yes stop_codon:yes gene_type:complete
MTGSGNTSGSAKFMFHTGAHGGYQANTVVLEGTLHVSGVISASHYHIENVIETTEFGSTYFGNSNDDDHVRTGSFTVANAAAVKLFDVDVGSTTSSFKTSVYLSGAVSHKRYATNSNYTVTTSDYYVGVGSASSGITITLPAASTTTDGQTFIIKDEFGHAQTNNITINRAGSDTIDGQNSVVLESDYASVSLYCNGSNKYFVF